MKKYILCLYGLGFATAVFGQSQISITLYDKNFMAIKQEDVKSIVVKICNGDWLTLNVGSLEVDLGKPYKDSLSKYLNAIPKE